MNRSNATTDLDPRPPALFDSTWTPVLGVFEESDKVRTFRVARPREFEFQAGQYLTVDVEAGQRKLESRYSISSAPESKSHLDITVKRRDEASKALHETVGAGSLLSIQAPSGHFVYPAGDGRPLVLIGGGSGCAPLMSMLQHAVVRDPSRQLTYLASIRTAKDVCFRRELNVLARHPRVRIGLTLTREGRHPGYLSGRIDGKLLARTSPSLPDSLFCIAGPPAMVAEMEHLLAGFGVPAGQIRSETFEAWADDHDEGQVAVVSRSRFASRRPDITDSDEEAAARARRVPLREEEIEWRIDDLREARTDRMYRPRLVEAKPSPSLPEPDPEPEASGATDLDTTLSRRVLRFPKVIREVLRFRRGERLLHWSLAIPFLTCFATGLSMKFLYTLHPDGISRDVLAFLHRVGGGSLAVFPTLAVLSNWSDLGHHLYNVKVGWIWTVDDIKWLFLMGPAAVSDRFMLPEQRKFNAAERLNFMMVMVTYPVFITTGVLLWMPGIHFVPWIVHVGVAVAVAPLVCGHVYMALINPGTRVGLSGMISGIVDREWAKHHYTSWYRDHYEEDGSPKQ